MTFCIINRPVVPWMKIKFTSKVTINHRIVTVDPNEVWYDQGLGKILIICLLKILGTK